MPGLRCDSYTKKVYAQFGSYCPITLSLMVPPFSSSLPLSYSSLDSVTGDSGEGEGERKIGTGRERGGGGGGEDGER